MTDIAQIVDELEAIKPARWKYHGYRSEDAALVRIPFGHLRALLARLALLEEFGRMTDMDERESLMRDVAIGQAAIAAVPEHTRNTVQAERKRCVELLTARATPLDKLADDKFQMGQPWKAERFAAQCLRDVADAFRRHPT